MAYGSRVHGVDDGRGLNGRGQDENDPVWVSLVPLVIYLVIVLILFLFAKH